MSNLVLGGQNIQSNQHISNARQNLQYFNGK